jgi:hypothetical protein
MATTQLTIDKITQEAQRILHQELNFVGNCNRTFDDSFGVAGGKIGSTLRIRLPSRFAVTKSATYTNVDNTDSSVALAVANQYHVPFEFTSADRALSIDDLSNRTLRPAMKQLASVVESDCFISAYRGIPGLVGTPGTAISSMRTLNLAGKTLDDNLAPYEGRMLHINSTQQVDINDASKGLFNDQQSLSEQFKSGMLRKYGGFDVYANTMTPRHTAGIATGTPLVDGAAQTGSTLHTDGWTAGQVGILKQGDVFTIAGVYDVHPETKVVRPELKKFLVTADVTSGGGAGDCDVLIYPPITTTGATQTVSAGPADDAAITVLTAPSTLLASDQSIAWHRDAFAFVTASLPLPTNNAEARQMVVDGINLRVALNAWDPVADNFINRIDILWGFKVIRPELACRIASA